MHITDSQPRRLPAGDSWLSAVIGESLVDIIRDPRGPAGGQAHPGAAPSTWQWGLRASTSRTILVTHYGLDPHGHLLEEHLQTNGVQVVNGGSAATSTALATLGSDGAAEYAFSITWAISGASLRPSLPSKVPPTSTRDLSPRCSRRGSRPPLPW